MSAIPSHPPAAARVADQLRGRLPEPWEVFAEEARRYEVHLNRAAVEMVRGPIALEGAAIRLFRSRGDVTGVGFAAATDTSPASVRALVEVAEANARHGIFPSSGVSLPPADGGALPRVEVADRALQKDPAGALDDCVDELVHLLSGRPGITLSFGSVRASVIQTSVVNSAGLSRVYDHTEVESEVSVKAFGGAEGPAPGEYWVNRRDIQLPTPAFGREANGWCEKAEQMRHAQSPPNGELPVILPTSVLADVLPEILGFRFGGAARLRKIAPELGARVGVDALTVWDDAHVPSSPGSAPFDDEGRPTARRPLISQGRVAGLLYDSLHAASFQTVSTASAWRVPAFFSTWFRFPFSPQPGAANLVVEAGNGGTDVEIAEGVEDGLWVDQLGYAFPDAVSGAFGGEIRAGYRIRHGKLAEPVRGGTVGGVLIASEGDPSFLSTIGALGSRPTLVGNLLAPTIRFDSVSVAGA